MELKQLRYYLALCRWGSFSRAAEQLNITQSALSRSILGLEEELAGPLLDRIGKRNELTHLGKLVEQYAQRILAEVGDLEIAVKSLNRGGLRSLKVGLGSGPGALLMTPLLKHMAIEFPTVKTVVSRGSTELQIMQLRKRELDALIVDARSITVSPELSIEHLATLPTGFIVRAGHPLVTKQVVTFTQLKNFPIASTPLSEEVARSLVRFYGGSAHPDQLVSLRCEEIESLIQVTKTTDAVFLGIRAAVASELQSGMLVQLPLRPSLDIGAQYALVSLAGRTEPASLGFLRTFVARYLKE